MARDGAGAASETYGDEQGNIPLPAQFLKLVAEFVRDIVEGAIDRAMLTAIYGVGRAIGIPTIAEWVENDAVKGVVRALGVGYAQGYGIARPERTPGHGPSRA